MRGIRKAFGGASAAQLLRTANRWRPWRAYAAMHLWQGLSDAPQAINTHEEVA